MVMGRRSSSETEFVGEGKEDRFVGRLIAERQSRRWLLQFPPRLDQRPWLLEHQSRGLQGRLPMGNRVLDLLLLTG